eukprot:438608-Pelagomonas_calceolata.AAC.1
MTVRRVWEEAVKNCLPQPAAAWPAEVAQCAESGRQPIRTLLCGQLRSDKGGCTRIYVCTLQQCAAIMLIMSTEQEGGSC